MTPDNLDYQTTPAVTREPFPIALLDLAAEVRQLRASPIPHGHIAKTLLHNRDLRMVLMVLQRGAKLRRHHAKGSLVVQVLDGRIVASLLDASFDVTGGGVLAIEPEVSHELVAIEDTAFLMTVVQPAPTAAI